jgi:hypothetical protein
VRHDAVLAKLGVIAGPTIEEYAGMQHCDAFLLGARKDRNGALRRGDDEPRLQI